MNSSSALFVKPQLHTESLDIAAMFTDPSSFKPSSGAWDLSLGDGGTNESCTMASSSSSSSPGTTPAISQGHSPNSSLDSKSPVSVLQTGVALDSGIEGAGPMMPDGSLTRREGRKVSCRTTRFKSEDDELVRRIHSKVGGPAALSRFDEPARVRQAVLEALAAEAATPQDASRIRRAQLSVRERRVVRTVTNRGAAVRSRMRQRKEMSLLRAQVDARSRRVQQLEAVVRALCSAYAVPLPPLLSSGEAVGGAAVEYCNDAQSPHQVHDLLQINGSRGVDGYQDSRISDDVAFTAATLPQDASLLASFQTANVVTSPWS